MQYILVTAVNHFSALRQIWFIQLILISMVFFYPPSILAGSTSDNDVTEHYYAYMVYQETTESEIKEAPVVNHEKYSLFGIPPGSYYFQLVIVPNGKITAIERWKTKHGLDKPWAAVALKIQWTLKNDRSIVPKGGITILDDSASTPINIFKKNTITWDQYSQERNKWWGPLSSIVEKANNFNFPIIYRLADSKKDNTLHIHRLHQLTSPALTLEQLNTFWDPEQSNSAKSLSQIQSEIENASENLGFQKAGYFTKPDQGHQQLLRQFKKFIGQFKEPSQKQPISNGNDNQSSGSLSSTSEKKSISDSSVTANQELPDHTKHIVKASPLSVLLFIAAICIAAFTTWWFSGRKNEKKTKGGCSKDDNGYLPLGTLKKKIKDNHTEEIPMQPSEIPGLNKEIGKLKKDVEMLERDMKKLQKNMPKSEMHSVQKEHPRRIERVATFTDSGSDQVQPHLMEKIKEDFKIYIDEQLQELKRDMNQFPQKVGKAPEPRVDKKNFGEKGTVIDPVKQNDREENQKLLKALMKCSGIRNKPLLDEFEVESRTDDLLSKSLPDWIQPRLAPHIYKEIGEVLSHYKNGQIKLLLPREGEPKIESEHEVFNAGMEQQGVGGQYILKVVKPGILLNGKVRRKALVEVKF